MQCNVFHFFNMLKLQAILKEIDENFTDDEIDDIILDVSSQFVKWNYPHPSLLQTDLDKSDTIDFDEWVKLMS